MLHELSFEWRLLFLVSFCATATLLDFRNPPAQRHRWREYLVLLCAAAAGAAAGMLFDALTSCVSPHYFEQGKSIPAGDRFFVNVLLLGAQAGTGAGVVVGAVLLVVNRESSAAFRLFRFFWLPFTGAALFGFLLALVQIVFPVASMRGLQDLVGDAEARWFLVVWMAHFGIYLGAVLGLCVAALRLRRSP